MFHMHLLDEAALSRTLCMSLSTCAPCCVLDFFCQLLNFLLKKCSAVSRDSRTLPLTLIISLSLSHSLLRLCTDSAQTCHILSETLQHTLLISNLLCHRLCQRVCLRFSTDSAQICSYVLIRLLQMLHRLCSDSAQTCHRFCTDLPQTLREQIHTLQEYQF